MDRSHDIKQLRSCADKYSEEGDIISATLLDDIAFLLSRGKTWDELLDDISIFESSDKIPKT